MARRPERVEVDWDEWLANIHDVFLNAQLMRTLMESQPLDKDFDRFFVSPRGRLERAALRDLYVLYEAFQKSPPTYLAELGRLAPDPYATVTSLLADQVRMTHMREVRDYMSHRDVRRYMDPGRLAATNIGLKWWMALDGAFAELLFTALQARMLERDTGVRALTPDEGAGADTASSDERVASALVALAAPGIPIAAAVETVPSAPGLYAVTAAPSVWQVLDLGAAPDARPLYVGKAEASLNSREVRTHFATGKTGSSTLRRSLAGLLAEHLDLRAQPRNPERPSDFDRFGLEPGSDKRLTSWMVANLQLGVWASPPGTDLGSVETAVLAQLSPPLNLAKVATPWRDRVSTARRLLADQARSWRPLGQPPTP